MGEMVGGGLAVTELVLMIFGRLFQVAVYLVIGFVSRRTELLDERTLPGLANLVYKICLPTVIFYSALRGARLLGWQSAVLPVLSLGVTAVSVGLSLTYQRWRREEQSSASVAVGGAFGNTAFLGIPLCAALFGPAAGAQAALCDFGNTLGTFTVGTHVLNRAREDRGAQVSLWRAAANRNTLALAAGLLTGRLPLVLPEWLLAPVAGVAGAALPVAMMVVGATIAGLGQKAGLFKVAGERLALMAALKLGVEPAAALAVAAVAVPREVRPVVVLIAAMPTMATLPVVARQFGGDEELIAAAVFLTTVLCFLTIPVWMLLV